MVTKKHRLVPSDFVRVSVSPAIKSGKVTKRGYRFANEQVRTLKNKAILYLRSRYDVKAGTVVHSLRNQNYGKGIEIIRCKPVPISQAGVGLDRLYHRLPFEFVVYVPYMEFLSEGVSDVA